MPDRIYNKGGKRSSSGNIPLFGRHHLRASRHFGIAVLQRGIPSKETKQRKFNLLGVLAITWTSSPSSLLPSFEARPPLSSPSLINTAVNDWLFYRGVAADIVKGRPDKEYQAENQDHQHRLPEQHQKYCP